MESSSAWCAKLEIECYPGTGWAPVLWGCVAALACLKDVLRNCFFIMI